MLILSQVDGVFISVNILKNLLPGVICPGCGTAGNLCFRITFSPILKCKKCQNIQQLMDEKFQKRQSAAVVAAGLTFTEMKEFFYFCNCYFMSEVCFDYTFILVFF